MKADAFNGQLDSLILAIVAEESGHGYVILQRLRERSTGVFELAEGSLYPALHRLERDGLLASSWSAGGGRRRRVYGITPAGHTVLQERRQEWRRFSAAVAAVLG